MSDVVVIGGGSAGLAAAVAAARAGAETQLIEASDQLGGMGTRALVHTFCGLYEPGASGPPKLANQGIASEIEQLTRQRSNSSPLLMGKVWVLPQNPSDYAALARELCAAESKLTLHYSARVTQASHSAGAYSLKLSSGKSISATSLVDCTGNAALAPLLSLPRHIASSAELQRPAYIFSVEGVDTAAINSTFKLQVSLAIVRAVQAGSLPSAAMGAGMRIGSQPGQVFITLDLTPTHHEWSPDSADAIAEVTELGRVTSHALLAALRMQFPAFHSAAEPGAPREIGIRESYRHEGAYTLTSSDLLDGRSFLDSVARAAWPIELREKTTGPTLTYLPAAADIPLSCLTSPHHPGFYFAGRTLSATHRALASVRVMGTCFATGEAAGRAAAHYSAGQAQHS